MSETISIKMRDLVPHKHAVRCTIEGSDQVHEIEVVALRWLDDGSKLSVMLDSHNFIVEEPDTVLDYIVELNPVDPYYRKQVDGWVLPPRPTPMPTVASLQAEVEMHKGLREETLKANHNLQSEVERLKTDIRALAALLNQVASNRHDEACRIVAERQREACAERAWEASGWSGTSLREHVRATPLVVES